MPDKTRYLAGPMEGVCTPPFVAAATALGLVDFWTTPFLRISAEVPSVRTLREFLAPYLDAGLPFALQLMGTDPERLAATARAALPFGPAAIDFNCGCPSRRVTAASAGGGMLRTPDLMLEILKRMRDAIGDVPLTVKMRTGYSSPEEMESILPAMAESGAVDLVTVHYRTVAEGYAPAGGRSERLALAAELRGGMRLVVNGDLGCDDDTRSLIAATGAAGAMFARGWVADPFLLRRMAGEPVPDPGTGRKMLYEEMRRRGMAGGNAIELAKMMWGTESAEFRDALANR